MQRCGIRGVRAGCISFGREAQIPPEEIKRVPAGAAVWKFFAHPLIVLLALPNEQEFSCFGIAAGRSWECVHRNRAKRLMRAALQPLFQRVAPGWDVILIARKPLLGASFPQIQSALTELSLRAKILSDAR
jgi:ribonuclease P protein component